MQKIICLLSLSKIRRYLIVTKKFNQKHYHTILAELSFGFFYQYIKQNKHCSKSIKSKMPNRLYNV